MGIITVLAGRCGGGGVLVMCQVVPLMRTCAMPRDFLPSFCHDEDNPLWEKIRAVTRKRHIIDK